MRCNNCGRKITTTFYTDNGENHYCYKCFERKAYLRTIMVFENNEEIKSIDESDREIYFNMKLRDFIKEGERKYEIKD